MPQRVALRGCVCRSSALAIPNTPAWKLARQVRGNTSWENLFHHVGRFPRRSLHFSTPARAEVCGRRGAENAVGDYGLVTRRVPVPMTGENARNWPKRVCWRGKTLPWNGVPWVQPPRRKLPLTLPVAGLKTASSEISGVPVRRSPLAKIWKAGRQEMKPQHQQVHGAHVSSPVFIPRDFQSFPPSCLPD